MTMAQLQTPKAFQSLTNDEKKLFLLKKYVSERIGELIAEVIVTILLACLSLFFITDGDIALGFIGGIIAYGAFSIGSFFVKLYQYHKSLRNKYPSELTQ